MEREKSRDHLPEYERYGEPEIEVVDLLVGRIVIELNEAESPKASANFSALCSGAKGKGKSGKPLHFKGAPFHRVVRGDLVQSGDFVRMDGSAGTCCALWC